MINPDFKRGLRIGMLIVAHVQVEEPLRAQAIDAIVGQLQTDEEDKYIADMLNNIVNETATLWSGPVQ